jgi:hypothetical protein
VSTVARPHNITKTIQVRRIIIESPHRVSRHVLSAKTPQALPG